MATTNDLADKSARAFHGAAATPDPVDQQQLLDEAQALAGQSELADAYAFLQRVVGVLAISLPFIVGLGNFASGGHHLQGSISAFYYTHMGNWFVGTLCALAVFFLSYNIKPLPGHHVDKYITRGTSVMAVMVAMFPTTSSMPDQSGASMWVGRVHITCATALFALLGALSMFFFTKFDPSAGMTARKVQRNRLYRACGATIFGCIVLIAVVYATSVPESWHSVFFLESIAVVAFGVSWLVKGGVGLTD